MTDNDFTQRLNDADQFFDAFRQMSEMLSGGMQTLMAEGWTEQQARDLVVAAFVSNARGAK